MSAEGESSIESVVAPEWSPDARWVAVSREEDEVRVLDGASAEVAVVHPLDGTLRALRWTSRDHLLLIVTQRGRNVARLLEMPDGGAVAEAVLFQGERVDLDVSVDGRMLWVSPRWTGRRLAGRYAAWLELPSLALRTSVDVLDIACRAAGLARDDANLLGGAVMDPEGHRVAVLLLRRAGWSTARASVVVVTLGGEGTVAGRRCIASIASSHEPDVVRWIGRDALIVGRSEFRFGAFVLRAALDFTTGSAACAILGMGEATNTTGTRLVDLDSDAGQALMTEGIPFNARLQRVSLATGDVVTRARPLALDPHLCLDRLHPDAALSFGVLNLDVQLRRLAIAPDSDASSVIFQARGERPNHLSTLPAGRGVQLGFMRDGRPQWVVLHPERLR